MPLETLTLNPRALAHVLRDRQLAVPPYQRPYAWTDDNVSEFWTDLRSALNRGDDSYFLGAIVLAIGTGQDGRDLVVDGQQRLATTSILLAAFRDAFLARNDPQRAQVITNRYLVFSDLNESNAPRLKLNAQDGEFYHERVILRRLIEPQTASHRRIAAAYDSLIQYVEEDVSSSTHAGERIASWITFLDKSAKIIEVDVTSEADAFLIFETLNDRGAELTIADLLKTYLLSRSGDSFGSVERSWLGAIEALGDFDEIPVLVDFIRHFWSSANGATRERDLYRSIRDSIKSEIQAVAFADQLPQEAENYAALLSPDHPRWNQFPSEMSEFMRILLQLGLTQNRPLLLAILAKFAEDQAVKAFRAIIAWSVRGLIVGGIGGGTTERAFGGAAVAVREGRIEDVRGLFDNLRPIIPGDDEFRSSFEGASVPRRKIAEYLIRALEAHISGAARDGLIPTDLLNRAFVHQVMPQQAQPQWWPGFAPDEIVRWVSRLGNYILFDQPRRPPPSWQSARGILEAQPFELTRMAARYDSWSPETLRARQAALAETAVALWRREPAE